MVNPEELSATDVIRKLLDACKELLEECGKRRAGDWQTINEGMVAGEKFLRDAKSKASA